MARAKNKPPTLLESAKSLPKRKRTRNWIDKIPDVNVRREIVEYIVAKIEGRHEVAICEMARQINAKFGTVCNRQSIDSWIDIYNYDRSAADVG